VPKIAPEISPAKVRNLMDRPGLHAVGGVNGLLLQVSRSKSGQLRRSWILRAMVGAKRRDIGLGSYPTVTVGIARDRARELREQIRQGVDPIAERHAARAALIAEQASAMTFRQCAAAYIEAHEPTWRNAKHRAQWRSTLETYVYPTIGKLPVAAVDVAHVVKIVEPLWQTKTETASRVRGRVETVLDWATARKYRSGDNPARWRGHLDHLLPKKTKVRKVRHQPAMPYRDVPAFMGRLRSQTSISARALEWTVLNTVRTSETIGATWDEIDFQSKTWTVPAHRIKAERDHRIPLCGRSIEILQALPRRTDNPYVFAGAGRGGLSNMAMLERLRGMDGNGYTVHGFRSSFRDWCAEQTNYPRELAEVALAHKLKDKTEAAYQRGDLLEKRRRLMRDWAKFVGTVQPATTARVISLQSA
jgi:integrase